MSSTLPLVTLASSVASLLAATQQATAILEYQLRDIYFCRCGWNEGREFIIDINYKHDYQLKYSILSALVHDLKKCRDIFCFFA
jgi:hypothetical protein